MRLSSYLKVTETSAEAFAAKVGVSPQAIYRYMSGHRMPRREVLEAIHLATEGSVTANDFIGISQVSAGRRAASDKDAA